MNFDQPGHLPQNTLYNLLQQLSFLLDNRYTDLRSGTRYSAVRPSDVRVFVQIARQARGESEIAKAMNVTRQAVQNSVKRLVAMKMVEVVPMANNGRNKIVQLTERGQVASATAAEQIRMVEAECAEIIGASELERLRGLLLHLTTGYKDAHSPKPRRKRDQDSLQATGV
jgi:DNA-binding MarR family transcriptional regulator